MVVGFLNLQVLSLDDAPEITRQTGVESVLILPECQVLSPLAFGDDRTFIPARDTFFDIHPGAMQGRAGMAAFYRIRPQPLYL